jgi:type IV pilus assembly protein PilF
MGAFLRIMLVVIMTLAVSCATTSKKDIQQAQAHYKMGVSHYAGGNIQAAFVEFQTALNLDPDNKDVHNYLGVVYRRLGDLNAAEEHFLKATAIDPEYSDALNNLCLVNYETRQYERAVDNCKKALENPLYASPDKAFYNMARAHYRLGNFDAAIDAYQEALKRVPGLYPAYYGLALCYNAKEEYGMAAEALGEAMRLDPSIRGDRSKAEEVFMTRKNKGENPADVKDLLEILNY